MPRLRVGVALLLPAPLDAEIDGMRRALGDGALGRMPAHLTLVPPVNVREDRLGDALAVLRRAAAATRPFTLTLGPPATFLPDSPTIHLRVSGPVQELRDLVFVEPLARPLTWPFVPHVTLADEAAPDRIAAAVAALAGYRAEATFTRVHLLREGPPSRSGGRSGPPSRSGGRSGPGRVWVPIADAPFAPPAVIGRGGLPVELVVTGTVDPEAAALTAGERLVVTARCDGAVAGVAEGWCRPPAAHLASVAVADGHLHLGVGSHLVAAFRSEAAGRGCADVTIAPNVLYLE